MNLRVAFQGERGAFSEEGAQVLFYNKVETVPRITFERLFSAIKDGRADYALVPLENSLAGHVARCYGLLYQSNLWIRAEIVRPIRHCLIGVPGATIDGLKAVQSHPVALAQCEEFFAEAPHVKRRVAEDTAGSVREVMQGGDKTLAAIAGKHAAGVYGARILRANIEDYPDNFTRFVLLGTEPVKIADPNKYSLAVRLKHEPGSLYHALKPRHQSGEPAVPPPEAQPLAVPVLSRPSCYAVGIDGPGTTSIARNGGRNSAFRYISRGGTRCRCLEGILMIISMLENATEVYGDGLNDVVFSMSSGRFPSVVSFLAVSLSKYPVICVPIGLRPPLIEVNHRVRCASSRESPATPRSVDGKQIVERLEVMDASQKLYRYTNVSGLGVVDYTGMFDVKPKATGSSVEWRVQFLADNQPTLIVRTIVATLMKTGFEALH